MINGGGMQIKNPAVFLLPQQKLNWNRPNNDEEIFTKN